MVIAPHNDVISEGGKYATTSDPRGRVFEAHQHRNSLR